MRYLTFRKLPQIIAPNYSSSDDAVLLQGKFENANAKFCDQYFEYNIFSLMSEEAILYWLPSLFNYLTHEAPVDSYFFDVVLINFAKMDLSQRLQHIATVNEYVQISSFIRRIPAILKMSHAESIRDIHLQTAISNWPEIA